MREETIKEQADRARQAEAAAVRDLAKLEAAAAEAEAAFKKDPSATTHADQAVTAQKAANARAALEALRAASAVIFEHEHRAELLAELEANRPGDEVKEAVAAFDALIDSFARELPRKLEALVSKISAHNTAVARCNAIARELHLFDRFEPRQLSQIVGTGFSANARPGITLGGYPDAPTSINFSLTVPVGRGR